MDPNRQVVIELLHANDPDINHALALAALLGHRAYLAAWDLEAYGGLGDASFTTDPNAAHVFPTAGMAWQTWRSTPSNRPLRDDGQPNRPLTAFTIAVYPLAHALSERNP